MSSPEHPDSDSGDSSSARAVRSLLSRSKRHHHSTYDISKDDEDHIDQLIKAMDEAQRLDLEANQSGLPALRKIAMVKRIVTVLKVAKYQEVFMEMNGCLVLAKWLSPMPDGCFPHSKILLTVLGLLGEMEVETEHLETFALGRAVMGVAEGAEDVQVRKKAKTLVDKWSRQIYGIDTSWAGLETLETAEAPSSEPSMHKLIQSDVNSGAVRIPVKNQFDFRFRPQSKAVDTARQPPVVPRFLQRNTKGRSRKLQSQMSADGRGLASE